MLLQWLTMIAGTVVAMDSVDGTRRRWFGGGSWMCCALLIALEFKVTVDQDALLVLYHRPRRLRAFLATLK